MWVSLWGKGGRCPFLCPLSLAGSQPLTPLAAPGPGALRGLYKYVCMTDLAPRVPVSDVIFGELLSNRGKCFGGSNFSVWQSHIFMQLG